MLEWNLVDLRYRKFMVKSEFLPCSQKTWKWAQKLLIYTNGSLRGESGQSSEKGREKRGEEGPDFRRSYRAIKRVRKCPKRCGKVQFWQKRDRTVLVKSTGQCACPVKPGHVTVTGADSVDDDDDDDDVVTVTLLFLSAI